MIEQEEDGFGRIVPKKGEQQRQFTHATVNIPRLEEEVSIDKRVVETAKVRVHKVVKEHQETIDAPYIKEEVNIERLPKNEFLTSLPPAVRQEGDTTIISVLEEVTVVEKKILLVEEVHIIRRKVEHYDVKHVTLLKEEIHIDEEAMEPPADSHQGRQKNH